MAVDLRPSNALVFGQLGVDAIVTPPSLPSVDAVVSWLAPTTARLQSLYSSQDAIEDQRPRLAVRRDQVTELPVGTEILVSRTPEFPDPVLWIVDRVEDLDPDVFYARVHRKDDA